MLGERDARGTGLKRGLWLIAAALLAYGSALPGDFVWLDHLEIERAGYRVEGVEDVSKLFRYSLDRYLIRDRVQPEMMSGGYFHPLYALSISILREGLGESSYQLSKTYRSYSAMLNAAGRRQEATHYDGLADATGY